MNSKAVKVVDPLAHDLRRQFEETLRYGSGPHNRKAGASANSKAFRHRYVRRQWNTITHRWVQG